MASPSDLGCLAGLASLLADIQTSQKQILSSQSQITQRLDALETSNSKASSHIVELSKSVIKANEDLTAKFRAVNIKLYEPAHERLICTPELVEGILCYLDTKDLLRCLRVTKSFTAIIDASPKLQRALMFLQGLTDKGARFNTLLMRPDFLQNVNIMLDERTDRLVATPRRPGYHWHLKLLRAKCYHDRDARNRTLRYRVQLDFQIVHGEEDRYQGYKPHARLPEYGGSWKHMYLATCEADMPIELIWTVKDSSKTREKACSGKLDGKMRFIDLFSESA